ncbi:MAG TPA: endonuclease/exonuclease/phosphatase family protein [Micromonosporaceae bacterium]|nr:endonuclease/exonuclease/phosphatase family protein [Micromonosporaceae bacterium]
MEPGPQIRVVSYNIHSSRDDLHALASVVRDLAPDVLVVQEGPRRFRWRGRCARLAQACQLVYAVGGLPALGNLVLTSFRVRVHDTWSLQFPLTPGRHMRGAAFATCSVGRVPFAVAGSHLSTDPAERPRQAALLKKAMAEVDLPLVLGADLNEGSGGDAWRTVAEGLVDAAAHDTAAHAAAAHDTAAAHDVAGRPGAAERATFSCAHPRERIDVLLTDPRIQVVRYDVVDTDQARRASDHFPVMADLILPAAPN